jgi:hypothetical protein
MDFGSRAFSSKVSSMDMAMIGSSGGDDEKGDSPSSLSSCFYLFTNSLNVSLEAFV